MNVNDDAFGAVVEFSSVDYSHPNGVRALCNISLSIGAGETVGLMGANGAGKSTLVRHINGLVKPTRGTVSVFGEDTRKMSTAALSRRVGIIFQNANNQLFASSVRAEIEFGLKNLGFSENIVKKRTDWALVSFGLEKYSEKSPMELSGGEKKRLCIALVLAWEPDILILDEPTVGQDSEQKEKIIETIKLLKSQNKTVVLVSHDIEFLWPIQPRIILMANGKVSFDGPAQKAFSDSSLLEEAHVLSPQLVDLWHRLQLGDKFPKDEFEAQIPLKKFVH